MLRALAFGFGVGAAVQGFRQWPADGPVTMSSAVVVFLLGLVVAYFGGARRRGGGASAVAVAAAAAEANASAVQSVTLVVQQPGNAAVGGIRVPDETVAWFGGERAAITADDLDGLDIAEVIEEGERQPD